ncbi:phage tail protein [Paraburkholderia sp. BR14263]|uniref:phage tail protein n=1 Tax=unclassified Paraburkholderia TaxID=2615204 RepID=UPI0034CF76C2
MAINPFSTVTNALQGVVIGSTASVTQFVNQLLGQVQGGVLYALLGDVQFGLPAYFTGSETRFGAEYAEHKLIDGKPRLQSTGDKLDEITWNVVFHAGFCDPEAELQKLRKLIASHTAAPLHFANGDYKGTFVATDCTVTTRQTMRDGTLVWLEGTVSLKEYVEPPVLVEQTASQTPVAAQTRSGNGITTPPNTVTASATARPSTASATRN